VWHETVSLPSLSSEARQCVPLNEELLIEISWLIDMVLCHGDDPRHAQATSSKCSAIYF